MTIRRATPEVEVKVGDFIAGASGLIYGICGRPGRVTIISGRRIYYDRYLQDGSDLIDSTFMNRDLVRFVCDTKEELDALMSLSEDRNSSTSFAVRAIEEQYAATTETLLNGLIKRFA